MANDGTEVGAGPGSTANRTEVAAGEFPGTSNRTEVGAAGKLSGTGTRAVVGVGRRRRRWRASCPCGSGCAWCR